MGGFGRGEMTPTLEEVRFRSPQMTNPAAPRAALSPMVWIKSFCRKHTGHITNTLLKSSSTHLPKRCQVNDQTKQKWHASRIDNTVNKWLSSKYYTCLDCTVFNALHCILCVYSICIYVTVYLLIYFSSP